MWLLVLPVKPVNPESGPKCLVCVTQKTRRFRKCTLCLAISRFFITLFLLQFVVDVAVLVKARLPTMGGLGKRNRFP